MKKTLIPITLVAVALTFNAASAQVSAKKNVTLEEVNKHINSLAQKDNTESKKELELEAKTLITSKNEQFVNLGARIFEYLGNTTAVEQAQKSILKKFPNGIKARQDAFFKIFNEDNTSSASEIEKQYTAWLKKFPSNNFDEKNQGLYDQGKSNMAIVYFRENNISKGNEYIEQLKTSSNFPIHAGSITNTLIKNKNYEAALPIIAKAYNEAKKAFYSNDPTIKRSNVAGRYTTLTPLYAEVLVQNNNIIKSTEILEDLLKNNSYSKSNPQTIILLANNYSKEGRDLDAFNLLNDFLINQSHNIEIVENLQPLYQKLNNQKGNFDNYLSLVKKQSEEAALTKYKSEMIKKDAPEFSLVNMKGETVSLKDLKGKVIVLDFWATWCGPCKISFPGMQAAVNKYKDDKDVEFLFIDTWQRETNYRELVEKFIADNKYTFNVLFDEMKDRAKATTTAYGVKGIPHKVVIDKEGFIRFESSGGSADIEKIVNEMSAKIELARKG